LDAGIEKNAKAPIKDRKNHERRDSGLADGIEGAFRKENAAAGLEELVIEIALRGRDRPKRIFEVRLHWVNGRPWLILRGGGKGMNTVHEFSKTDQTRSTRMRMQTQTSRLTKS
jgi:hypothetical protein